MLEVFFFFNFFYGAGSCSCQCTKIPLLARLRREWSFCVGSDLRLSVGKICSFVSSVGARMLLSNGAFMELCLKHSLICSVNFSFHVKNSNCIFFSNVCCYALDEIFIDMANFYDNGQTWLYTTSWKPNSNKTQRIYIYILSKSRNLQNTVNYIVKNIT